MFTLSAPKKPLETARNKKSTTLITSAIVAPESQDISGGISLAEFVRESWAVLEPSTELDWNWHLDAICLHVQELLLDWKRHRIDSTYIQRAQNLLVNICPGSGKSRIVSVCAPAWMWLHWPSWRSIFISANPSVALRDSLYCKDLITSDWYQDKFSPPWTLRPDQNVKSNYWNTAGGCRLAIGVGSRLTGSRGDALFCDDLNDATEVESVKIREHVNDRWDNAIRNRVNDLQSSVRFGIQQRLHTDDWSGHVLKSGKWEHLCIPQEWEEEQRRTTCYGWIDPRTIEGELMFPKRFPASTLEEEEALLGSYGYAGQHQQRPVAREGGMIKGSWFQRYNIQPEWFDIIVQSWDTASKAAAINDPWVCGTWGIREGRYYLLDVFRKRMEYPEGKRMAGALALQWEPGLILIEDKSTGQTLIQDLRNQGVNPGNNLIRHFSIIPILPDADKITRMSVESPTIEAGRMHLPEMAPWLATFENELTTFPNSSTKDQVDMVSQFLKWAKTWNYGGTIAGSEDRGSVEGVLAML